MFYLRSLWRCISINVLMLEMSLNFAFFQLSYMLMKFFDSCSVISIDVLYFKHKYNHDHVRLNVFLLVLHKFVPAWLTYLCFEWAQHTQDMSHSMKMLLLSQGSFCVVSNQWEMTLHCIIIPYWLGAYAKWSLVVHGKSHEENYWSMICHKKCKPNSFQWFHVCTLGPEPNCYQFANNIFSFVSL